MNDLLNAARLAFERAYAPYSNFKVGAALRTPTGNIYAGANVENAAYPIGNCAEASAIAAMVAAGEREIVECAVVAEGERLCTPCGGCRQRLAEFSELDLKIHIASPEGHRQTLTLGELLPHGFDLPDAGNGDQGGDAVERTVAIIREHAPNAAPRVGLILGSGLGGFADGIEQATAIDYADLPGFPRPSVEGHSGRLVLGTVSGLDLACLQGRVHLYEGNPASATNIMVRTLRALGCEILIVTNAAGSLRPNVGSGSLVLIEDHINMLGHNPLIGPGAGQRFIDMSEAYSADYREKVQAVAAAEDIELATGVYLATPGPSFETPAEIHAFKALGADLVGMSTVPEVIAARHAGLDVIGFSIVTNLAAGMSGTILSHEETLSQASAAGTKLAELLTALFKELARHGRK
ncbi:MAG: purine-nucleoside phosphorylase [Alphaproteobacteria bacterium]|nr:purine-nucleoside phosphorylase [Alphaproteobacteria bacterium]